MNVRDELSIVVECAKRGALVGIFAGAATNSLAKGAAFTAVAAVGIYLSAKSNQFAAEPVPVPRRDI